MQKNAWKKGSFMKSKKVLIVDDEQSIRGLLSTFLGEMGVEPLSAPTAEDGLALMDGKDVAVALVDIRLPGMDGLELCREIKKISPDTEVVIITSFASIDTAIEAIRNEAYDYIQKPFDDLDQVWVTVERAFEKRKLSLHNRDLLKVMERRNLELTAAVKRQTSLIEAGRAMSGIHTVDELLDFFIEIVAKELGAERASLMLIDESTGEMRIVASRGISQELIEEVRVNIGDGISGWVAKTGKPILVKDVKTDPRIKDKIKSHLSDSFISAPITLSIPIIFHEKVLGVINVTNKRSKDSFNDDDMAYLFGLAGQAAVSIKRGKQFEELQVAYDSLKATQDQLISAERLKALGQMAAGVAHDFNNVLNGVMGRAQLLLLELAKPKSDADYLRSELKVIEEISSQGAETVKRIQDFSGIRNDLPGEAIDINDIVRNAVSITQPKWKNECEATGLRIEVRTELGDLPDTAGNSYEISQVLHNLIFNAVDAMPGGGQLTIETSREGKFIRLDVADTGVGMSENVRSRIFEPFFSTKEEGNGLGLSVIHGIVSRYGGKISVESEEGKGTRFIVRIPVFPPPVGAAEKKAGAIDQHASGRVLLVEDDESNRKLVRNALSLNGLHVVDVSEGAEGLSIFKREKFDLVITDLSMPGMSGWEVAKGIKEINPAVSVILLSGWAVQHEKEKLQESGIDYVLSKPCGIHELREKVDQVLRERSEVL
jgi:signal transduction histidine kinase/DNA-binding response OmpR family regulator